MNKKTKIYLIGVIIVFMIYWSLNAMMGNITSKYYYLLIFIAAFVFLILDGILLKINFRKIEQFLLNNEHEMLIKKINEIVTVNTLIFQSLYLNVSISSLRNSDNSNFYIYIKKVKNKKLLTLRYFWETVHYIEEVDLTNAKKKYILFLESPRTLPEGASSFDWYNNFLQSHIAYYSGDKQYAREKITQICKDTRNPILKSMCSKIMECNTILIK